MLMKCLTFLLLFFSKGMTAPEDKSLEMHKEYSLTVKLRSWNPKYFYFANITRAGGWTIFSRPKYPLGNNVTCNMIYETMGPQRKVYNITTKLCDVLFKLKWAATFMKKFTNIFATGCPVPAGDYRLANIELIPKYSPFMDPKTAYDYIIRTHHTTQKANVMSIIMMNRLRKKQKLS